MPRCGKQTWCAAARRSGGEAVQLLTRESERLAAGPTRIRDVLETPRHLVQRDLDLAVRRPDRAQQGRGHGDLTSHALVRGAEVAVRDGRTAGPILQVGAHRRRVPGERRAISR